MKRAIKFARDVGQVTDRYTAMPDFDGRVKNCSVTDCIEPILQMWASEMTAPFPLVDEVTCDGSATSWMSTVAIGLIQGATRPNAPSRSPCAPPLMSAGTKE